MLKPSTTYFSGHTKKYLSAFVLGSVLGFGSVAYAKTDIEANVKKYIAEYQLEDKITYKSLEQKSNDSAILKEVSIKTEDDEIILLEHVKINKFQEDEKGDFFDIEVTGITDQEGTHYLLSEKNDSFNFKELDYDSLDPLKLHLVSSLKQASDDYELKINANQKKVGQANLNLDASSIAEFFRKYKKLSAEVSKDLDKLEDAMNPLALFNDLAQVKINRMALNLDNDGVLKQMEKHDSDKYQKMIEDFKKDCNKNFDEFMDQEKVTEGCDHILAFLKQKEKHLEISLNPEKGLVISEAMMAFMTMQPEAIQSLIKRLGLKIEN